MKEAVSNVDLCALAAELSPLLVGARFEKAFQPAKDEVLLRFRRKGVGRLDLLYRLGRFVTVVRRPPANPDMPSMVAKILRSTFSNARVIGVEQVGFDRILRFRMERGDGPRSIVLELFGDGNLLILDEDDTIELPMRGEDYAHRRLRKGEAYVPPPAGPHPFHLDPEGLAQAGQEARRDLVRFLALDLGFGPLWAEDLCLRAAVDKTLRPQDLQQDAWQAIYRAIQEVASQIGRNDLAPAVVFCDGKPVDAVPLPMRCYEGAAYALEEAPTFREALDAFFVGGEEREEDPRQMRFDDARARVERQVAQMEQAIAGFEHDEQDARLDGDTLYASFQEAQQILDALHDARSDRSWQEVEAVLAQARGAGDEAALRVPELRPHTGIAVLRLTSVDGTTRDVEVDLRMTVQQNADRQYTAAKKARARQDGARRALEQAKDRLAELDAKGLDAFGAAPSRKAGPRRHFWFETYRWTVTPGGFVAVGGRNAAQNDAVVKKYLRDGDRYVHAEIHGAPSVVVRRAEGPAEEIPEEDLRVACQFAVCTSRAWRQFGAAAAYWVKASQVSKTPRTGEFVPRGAWIIHGKRNVVSGLPMQWGLAKLRFAPDGRPVPVDAEDPQGCVQKLAGGVPEVLATFAEEVLALEPGDQDANQIAAALAQRLEVDVEAVQGALPGGPVRVVS